jgi:tRNA pseudouridine55 synthase
LNAPRRAPRRVVDGVLLLDKPAGLTSNAALQRARRHYNAAKAGHTGTLDPLATGLLPLCFGEATKFAGALLEADKEYEATLQFGVVTDTGDAEGRVLHHQPVALTLAEVEAALPRLRGPIEQVPPMYSALKHDGKALHEYARAGIEVVRAPRPVTIHALELTELCGEQLRFRVHCSKGTYVRTLAEDLGQLLGCGAHLTALRRTRIGPLRLADAIPLARLEQLDAGASATLLQPVDALLGEWPGIALDEAAAEKFAHGQKVLWRSPQPGPLRVYCGERFLGLGEAVADGHVQPRRLLAS